MALSDEQLDRYARHIVLREVGGAGQLKLLNAKVIVIGAGGIGAPALMYLAAAGVGHLGIIDDDVVSLSNLQRQIIHKTQAVGQAKTQSAQEAIADINPDVKISLHETRLNETNAEELLAPYDIILDGCDNFETRFLVNDVAQRLGKTLVSAAVGPFDGQLSTFKPGGPCYRCFVPDAPAGGGGTCADEGVLGALTGIMGSLAAMEVIKEITGAGDSLAGKILIYDALSTRFRTVRLAKDPSCPCCGA
ncbi:MAG: HesA/MoeB/ThiF family protein [Sphingomonadales bacterium]|jgi:adenylyltransferase/sulfurtransferase